MDNRSEIRLNKELLIDIQKAVNNNPEVYTNKSHLIRIAIIRELRRITKQGVKR